MKAFLFIAILFSLNSGHSQVAGPYISIGYSIDRFETAGINQFHETFNSFWQGELTNEWQNLKGNELSSPFFNIGFRGHSDEKIGLSWATGFQYNQGSHLNGITWNSGVIQQYKLKSKDFLWTAQAGIAFDKWVNLDFFIAGGGRNISLRYTTIYQNGEESIGSEYKLNGYYDGLVALFDLGAEISVNVGSFSIFGRYTVGTKNFPPSRGLVTIEDYSSNNYPPTDFPSNYTTYATDVVGYVENNEGVKTDDFLPNRLAFGVTYIVNRQQK